MPGGQRKRGKPRRPERVNPEAAAEKRNERLQDLHDKLAEGVESLTTSEGWRHMLTRLLEAPSVLGLQRPASHNAEGRRLSRGRIQGVAGHGAASPQGRARPLCSCACEVQGGDRGREDRREGDRGQGPWLQASGRFRHLTDGMGPSSLRTNTSPATRRPPFGMAWSASFKLRVTPSSARRSREGRGETPRPRRRSG